MTAVPPIARIIGGLASWRVGRKLQWNPEKEKIVKDKEANKLMARKYRKEWDLM